MFQLLDHLDLCEVIENTNTQVTITCPVCYSKIRISKKTSAYFCVAGCKSSEIRSALNLPVVNQRREQVYYAPIRPIECPVDIELHRVSGQFPLEQSVYFSSNPLDCQKVRRTIYVYDATHRVIRIDRLVDKDKRFYPLLWRDGEWIVEADDPHPLMHEGYISDSKKFVVFVEGEKKAVALCRQGILALTPSSFGWSEERLKKNLNKILYDIRGVIALPDNDDTGWRKMLKVQRVCWEVGLPCKLLSFPDLYEKPGDDVADLIERNIDVVSLLQERLREKCWTKDTITA